MPFVDQQSRFYDKSINKNSFGLDSSKGKERESLTCLTRFLDIYRVEDLSAAAGDLIFAASKK